MNLREFLDKETPTYGGFMVVSSPRKDDTPEYLLIERHKPGHGPDLFTVNNHFYHDYEFLWDEITPWTIIYKHEI